MTKFIISQFGKRTVRYSLSQALKVMNDRKLLRGDRGLLWIFCDNVEEANRIRKNSKFNETYMQIHAYHNGVEILWSIDGWYDLKKHNDYFEDINGVYPEEIKF